jgi:peptide-methionine (S)-S-oxide reductase
MKSFYQSSILTFVTTALASLLTPIVFAQTSAVSAAPTGATTATPAGAPSAPAGLELATFAGGCFWCMEKPFDELAGVKSTISGYMGGFTKQPTYEQISTGKTGHAEVVQVTFDPKVVSYEKLLEVFWRNIDPTVKDQQFCDKGSQYRSGVFVHSESQRTVAAASKAKLEQTKPFKETVVTEISNASEFTAAEEYHQDYYKKNPIRYSYYRTGCGRDARLKQLWGAK